MRLQRTRKHLLLWVIRNSSGVGTSSSVWHLCQAPEQEGNAAFACAGSAVPEHLVLTSWHSGCRFISRLHTQHLVFCSSLLFPNSNVNYLTMRLQCQQTLVVIPSTENQLTSTAGCLSTPGSPQALLHSLAIAGSVLDGCSLIVLPSKSVPAVEQSLQLLSFSTAPHCPWCHKEQPHEEPPAAISEFGAAEPPNLGKLSNTVPSRCLPLCPFRTSQLSPWEELLGRCSLRSLQPGCQCRVWAWPWQCVLSSKGKPLSGEPLRLAFASLSWAFSLEE